MSVGQHVRLDRWTTSVLLIFLLSGPSCGWWGKKNKGNTEDGIAAGQGLARDEVLASGVDVRANVPIPAEHASLLAGLSIPMEAGRGVGGQGVQLVARADWDGVAITESATAALKVGESPGVQVLGAAPDGRREIRLRSAKAGRLPLDGDYFIQADFTLPFDSVASGRHVLAIEIALASHVDLPLIAAAFDLEMEVVQPEDPSQPVLFSIVPVETRIEAPDQDGDGVVTLVEVAVGAVEGSIEAGAAAATNPTVQPSSEEILSATSQESEAALEEVLVSQGTPTDVVVPPVLDAVPPETSAVASPAGIVAGQSITFTFSCNEASCTYKCMLDGGAQAPCTSPHSLTPAVGTHTLRVQAVDSMGNIDTSPAEITFVVSPADVCGNGLCEGYETIISCNSDCGPIAAAIASGPTSPTSSTSATFSFACSVTSCSYECSLNGGPYSACTNPHTLSGLPSGSHTLSAKARDLVGGRVSGPVSHTWTVDATAPTFSGLTSVRALSASQIELKWGAASDNQTPATDVVYVACQSTTAGACQSNFVATHLSSPGATTFTATGLTEGTKYYFVVRARDALANEDPNVAQAMTIALTPGGLARRSDGLVNGDNYGEAMGVIADLNADGITDYIIGARAADSESTACPATLVNRGYLHVRSGADGTVLYRFCGDSAGDRLGEAVASAGDVNGDGKADIIAGAPEADSEVVACAAPLADRGYARVLSGADGSILHRFCGDVGSQFFGSAVGSAGDVNGDGKADVIVGADLADSEGVACPGALADRGVARVYSGADGSILYRWCGGAADDKLGNAVGTVGDVNGDGKSDILLAIHEADQDATACPTSLIDRGAVKIISGADGTTLVTVCGEAAQDEFGESAAAVGDVNGDGSIDVAAGSHQADLDPTACPAPLADRGSARVFSSQGGAILLRVCGEAASEFLGNAVGAAGDVNADGKADILVGAYLADLDPVGCPASAADRGLARIYSGADGSVLYRFCGSAADEFGFSLGNLGDFNGDGRADPLVGARVADPDGISATGSVYLYYGQ